MTISKHKNGFYYVYYIDPITNKRLSKSTSQKLKKDALKFLSEFSLHLENLKNKKLPVMLKDAIDKHLVWSEGVHTRNTSLTYKTTFNAALKFFGNVDINSLDANRLDDFFNYRLRSVSIYQTRKDYIHLHCLFNRNISKNLIAHNPCSGIERFRLPEKQPLYFTEVQFKLLLNTIDNHDINDLVRFAVNTGLRQMELITLRWSNILSDQKILLLDNRDFLTKSKKVRQVPLNQICMDILRCRQLFRNNFYSTEDLVFTISGKPYTQDGISKRFKRYVLQSGVDKRLNFHSLRHTYATWLVQRGVSIYKVSKLLGHSDVRVTQIYANIVIDDLHQAVKVLENN